MKRLNADLQRGETHVAQRTISAEAFDQIVGDQAEAEAAVSVAKANLDLAKQNLDYTKISAKIYGRMSRTLIDPGNLVKVDETVLTTIVSMDPIFVTFGVDEHLLRRVHTYVEKGMLKPTQDGKVPVLMGLASEEGFPHQGYVNFVDNHLDINTGTLQVRGLFDNSQQRILPGLVRTRAVAVGRTVPRTDGSGTGAGHRPGAEIRLRGRPRRTRSSIAACKLAGCDGQRRVILKGIAEGDRVVVSGLQRIRAGAVVDPKFAAPESQAERQKSQGTVQTAIQSTERNDGEKR